VILQRHTCGKISVTHNTLFCFYKMPIAKYLNKLPPMLNKALKLFIYTTIQSSGRFFCKEINTFI